MRQLSTFDTTKTVAYLVQPYEISYIFIYLLGRYKSFCGPLVRAQGLDTVTLPEALGLCMSHCSESADLLTEYWRAKGVNIAGVLNRANHGREFGPTDMAIYLLYEEIEHWNSLRGAPTGATQGGLEASAHLQRIENILANIERLIQLGGKVSRSTLQVRLVDLIGRLSSPDPLCRDLRHKVEVLRSLATQDRLGD